MRVFAYVYVFMIVNVRVYGVCVFVIGETVYLHVFGLNVCDWVNESYILVVL